MLALTSLITLWRSSSSEVLSYCMTANSAISSMVGSLSGAGWGQPRHGAWTAMTSSSLTGVCWKFKKNTHNKLIGLKYGIYLFEFLINLIKFFLKIQNKIKKA